SRLVRLLRPLAALEHLEHPVGDDEAADDVGGGEHDGDEAEDPGERALVGLAEHDHRADDHDAVDRVRPRHQRCVQQRRHLRDHLDPEEDREHEDGHLEDENRVVEVAREVDQDHAAAPFPATQAPLVISSDQSRESSPPGARWRSSAWTFREYSVEAWYGIVLGRLVVPTSVTPARSTISPG